MRSSTACTSGTTSMPSTTMPLARRRAQGDVQRRSLFGDVDVLAAEHRRDVRLQAAGVGQVEQQRAASRR